MSVVPYRPRFVNKFWAWLRGYFWKSCPRCHRMFGGHEWGETLMLTLNEGTALCRRCSSGRTGSIHRVDR